MRRMTWHFAFWECRRRTRLPWERALCQVGRRTRFLNCERFERRYDARNDGFFASRRRRKCAQSNRVAASAVSVSALRRELPRSHKHRVCDAWNERRPGFKRFRVWHGQRNFFHWIFCAANSRGAAGGTLERQTSPRDNADNLGALTTLTGFVRTPLELYGARFLLGAAEAGFFPGVIVYLSHWFVYQDRAKAVARFMSAIPIAYILGGPLAGMILRVHWLDTAGWRWLFLLEGVPAILLGIATLFVLPDRPNEVRWLQPNERDWLSARLAEERRAKAHVEHVTIWQALRHPAVLMLTAGLFFCYTGGYAFWFWMPTMLQRLTGWTDVQRIGWIGAIPFVAGLIGMLLLGWNSDRTRERRWHFAVPQLTAALALGAWFLAPHSIALLIVVFTLIGFGTVAYLPSFWALPSSFLDQLGGCSSGRLHQLHGQHWRILWS